MSRPLTAKGRILIGMISTIVFAITDMTLRQTVAILAEKVVGQHTLHDVISLFLCPDKVAVQREDERHKQR